MLVDVIHSDWQVLRVLARSRKKPVVGYDLRLDMSRRTQDGKFLTGLATRGLIKVVKAADHPFDAEYVLTPEGAYAAEYGVHDARYDKALGLWIANPLPEKPVPIKPVPRKRTFC